MEKVRITQTRSTIKRPKKQRLMLRSLGLNRLHQTVEVECTRSVRGMIAKVSHLISVKNL